MSKPFKGTVNIDIKDSTPDWEPYTQPIAPTGAPNVLYVVLDDVGFSAMEPYGGLIETPNIKRIAEQGLTYTNFHTTALCSPTRSCLLTGRNHTTNGMGCITEATSGFPNANGHIPFECANIAEVLGERGWNTYIVGKWHLCAEDEMNLASSKRQWPLGRGFERYYGFLGGETNQWYPGPRLRQPPRRAAEVARGGLPPDGRPHRQGDRVRPGREGDRAGQAVLPLLLPRRRPRAAPRLEGVGRQVQGQVRHGLRGLPRARVRAAEEARDHRRGSRAVADRPVRRHDEPRRQAVVAGRPRPALGLALRRREAALLPDGRGVRRLPQPRRPRARPAARLPRGERPARQHDHRARLRQRRLGRGRAERLGQREQVLQRDPRHDRGEPQVPRRARQHRGRTTTIRPAGRGRSTRRSSCGSATRTTRAAPPTR